MGTGQRVILEKEGTFKWPLDGFSNSDFELSFDSEPTPEDGTTLARYNPEPAPAEILYVLDYDSDMDMTIEDESLLAGFTKEIEISQLEKERLGIPLDLIDNSVQDDSNATAVASTSQNSLMKRRRQTLQGTTGSKHSKKV
ncbi:uncharacterized protein EDB93DRAFT_1250920 [Suillus bovinus]|uniref:uncharacterized protein n=1 Tax=Suillus bovinus TaxID=48563 RepID=UPI001B86E2AB|nr:uncharacterized protein EDB93DRAFT_1250920 [Suillus bovinus]KAG2146381.1 hypothetical protein EDB93DRAFT_1250920 [Suillus bovinus]